MTRAPQSIKASKKELLEALIEARSYYLYWLFKAKGLDGSADFTECHKMARREIESQYLSPPKKARKT